MTSLLEEAAGLDLPDDVLTMADPQPFQALWSLASLLWLPAYLCLLYGHRWATWVLALVAAAFTVAGTVVGLTSAGGVFDVPLAYQLLFGLVPVLGLFAFHQTAPPVRPGPWLLALAVGVVITFTMQLLTAPAVGHEVVLDRAGMWCVGLTIAAVVMLTAIATGRRSLLPHWPLALALFALGAFGLRVTTLTAFLTFAITTPDQSVLALIAKVEGLAVLSAAASLGVVAALAWRRLPAPLRPSAT